MIESTTAKSTILEEVNLLVEEGLYPDQQALLQDALRALLRSKPELRVQLALIMYKHNKLSFSRAANIAGVDLESLKELLREAGIERTIPPVGKAIEGEIDQLMRFRNSKTQWN